MSPRTEESAERPEDTPVPPHGGARDPPILTAVLDADVLYPAFLRDVLLRLAVPALFLPRWTERIQEEWERNVLSNLPDITPEQVSRIQARMRQAFPEALVVGYEAFEDHFPDVHPKDRHVAAAALTAGAQRIVTRNVRHFPPEALTPHGIKALDPDAFLSELLIQDVTTVQRVLEAHRVGLLRPPHTRESYRAAFRAAGLERAASLLW